jgi:hypothetical protein
MDDMAGGLQRSAGVLLTRLTLGLALLLGSLPAQFVAMVQAIARAELLVQSDLGAAEEAVVHALPALERRHVHTILAIYRPAVPATPRVSVDGLLPALALFPTSRTAPSLEGVPLADFVAVDLLQPAPIRPAPPAASPPSRPSLGIEVAAGTLAVLAALFALSRRRGAT